MSAIQWFMRAALIACAASPASSDILANGPLEPTAPLPGFEQLVPGGSNAIQGWTTVGTGVRWFVPEAFGMTPAPAGPYVVDLNTPAGGIRQDVPTVPGLYYFVRFMLGTRNPGGFFGQAVVDVSAGNHSESLVVRNASATLVWVHTGFAFEAQSEVTTVRLSTQADGNSHEVFVDGLRMDLAVPAAPTTWGRIRAAFR